MKFLPLCLLMVASLVLNSCSQVDVPGPRNLKIPQPTMAGERKDAVNERPDSVMYLPLGKDVLIPEVPPSDPLPNDMVGPFELRGETLAGALQLITSDYNIPMAFESGEALSRQVTVSNMKGPLARVVHRVCSLADLYCSYEDGTLIIKDTQTFTVSVPPVSGGTEGSDIINAVSAGVQGITGLNTITDTGTRTIIYEATQRSSELVERYFQRMRRSTALVIFEIYIWEVSLNNGSATGIQWNKIMDFGKYTSTISIPGSIPADFAPISIGLPTAGDVDASDIVRFISEFGAVKTISQPQITMLSGSSATLRAADTINYVSSLQRTVDNGEVSVSTETDSVDTGFTLEINANWDHSTVYSNIAIELQEFKQFETFGEGTETELQLPETTEREVSTQVRIRPGDSLLIAGLVRETDQYNNEGPGFRGPLIPLSRSSQSSNVELVFLMKPRVVVYTTDRESGPVQKNADPLAEDTAHVFPVEENKLEEAVAVPEAPMMPSPFGSAGDHAVKSNKGPSEDGDVVNEPMKEIEGITNEPTIGTLPLDLLNPN